MSLDVQNRMAPASPCRKTHTIRSRLHRVIPGTPIEPTHSGRREPQTYDGASAIIEPRDALGVVVLAAAAALAGGITRELLIGVSPATFPNWHCLAAVAAAGGVCYFAGPALERIRRSVLMFDAIGIGLFCVTGAAEALDFGLGPARAILLGAITGIGGGMLRDVLLLEIPVVLKQEPYAIPALLGAGISSSLRRTGAPVPCSPSSA